MVRVKLTIVGRSVSCEEEARTIGELRRKYGLEGWWCVIKRTAADQPEPAWTDRSLEGIERVAFANPPAHIARAAEIANRILSDFELVKKQKQG